MFLNGRTRVACALDFTSIDEAWHSIDEALKGAAAERERVLCHVIDRQTWDSAFCFCLKKQTIFRKIKPIVEHINNRNKQNKIETIAVLRFALKMQKSLIQMIVCRGTFRTA